MMKQEYQTNSFGCAASGPNHLVSWFRAAARRSAGARRPHTRAGSPLENNTNIACNWKRVKEERNATTSKTVKRWWGVNHHEMRSEVKWDRRDEMRDLKIHTDNGNTFPSGAGKLSSNTLKTGPWRKKQDISNIWRFNWQKFQRKMKADKQANLFTIADDFARKSVFAPKRTIVDNLSKNPININHHGGLTWKKSEKKRESERAMGFMGLGCTSVLIIEPMKLRWCSVSRSAGSRGLMNTTRTNKQY